jgi:hypothetical protein
VVGRAKGNKQVNKNAAKDKRHLCIPYNLLVLAGTNLGILQQRHAASQTKQQEQKIAQDISGNIDKRSAASQQHMDQENLCLRDGKCTICS